MLVLTLNSPKLLRYSSAFCFVLNASYSKYSRRIGLCEGIALVQKSENAVFGRFFLI